MKKLGLLCLVVVLALGALGAAYSMWFDQVVILGDVQTGSLDLEVTRTDGDDVYKELSTGALVYDHWIYDYVSGSYLDPKLEPNPDLLLVANSESWLVDDDYVRMYWNNIFPFTGGWGGFIASVRIHALGSVPMHLQVIPYLWNIPAEWVSYEWFVYETEGGALIASGTDLAVLDGFQLHYCNIVSIQTLITVPQDDAAMNVFGYVDMTINGIQWNEYNP